MKKMRKLIAVVLALTVAMTMGIASTSMVFAADDEPAASITINSTATGGTDTTSYKAYELLKASINGDAVSYYLPSPGGDSLKALLDAVTVTKGSNTIDLFTFTKSADGTRWIAKVNDAITESDGELIAKAVNTSAIKAAALATKEFAQNNGSATTGEVDPGYYLVTSSLGDKLVIQTLKNVTIDTKNQYITDVKTASKTNMNVGDTVTYTLTVHVPATATVGEEVTVHDTLDEHLAIKANTIAAKLGETSVTLTDGTKKAATETFAKKFVITQAMIDADVVITYDAELLSTAADDTGYVNTTFANDDSYETNPSEVKVYTFDFDLDKNFQDVTGDDASKYSATFELRTNAGDDSTAISFITDATGYVKADSDDTGASTVLTINGKDNINVRGLAAGTYYLVEKTTADGYNLLTDPVEVKITDTTTGTQPSITPSHTVSYKIGSGSETTGTVTVENQKGGVLPSTGGIGTTIFYILGALLVVGCGIILIARRRSSAHN